MNTYSKKTETEQCTIPVVRRSFSHTKVNLRNEDIVGMISTYEFLVWNNEAEDKKHCQRVLRKLKKAINYANDGTMRCTAYAPTFQNSTDLSAVLRIVRVSVSCLLLTF